MTCSPVKNQENSYNIPTTSTTNHHAQRIVARLVCSFNLNTNAKLTAVSKGYMFFQIDVKSHQVLKCFKSRIMTKVIYCVLSIDKSEQQCVMLEGMLQSPRLKYHM